MMLDPFISLFLRAGFSLIFVLTAWHKLRDLPGFKNILIGYNIMPLKTLPVLAMILPFMEIAIAALLIFLPYFGVFAAGALLCLYALIMAFNIARGNTQIDCGCMWGGDISAFPKLSWAHVLRNLAMVSILALALIPTMMRALGVTDWTNLILGVGFVFVAVKTSFTLMAIYGRMREFGHA